MTARCRVVDTADDCAQNVFRTAAFQKLITGALIDAVTATKRTRHRGPWTQMQPGPAHPHSETIAMHHNPKKVILPVAFVFVLLSASGPALAQHQPAASIPAADLIQPVDLAANLKSASTPKALILHIGFRKLYAQAHIPGSEYVGAARDDAGLQLLRGRVAKLSKDSMIVIYCGCCPWSDCPNIAAAYDALHALGFKQVKALYIASNLGTNWIDKGYPITKGG